MLEYKIGNKKYVQRRLVMGQVDQLLDALEGIKLSGSVNPLDIQKALGDKIYLALAIVLVEEGKSPKRDIDELRELASEIQWAILPEQEIEVIENFFDCNPIVSILERLPEIAKGLIMGLSGLLGIVSATQSSSLPKGTSAEETPSSGVSRSGSASPT